ncbi:hypothetical protein INR49_000952 [Caranx melampygus]|nr:hypothetical protein INR49_000952 [Caranx melampygus]
MIICWINSERIRDHCVTYSFEHGIKSCDPRFTLTTENQTVFLQLSSLTSEDSGNYTCQCSTVEGTYIVQLNITAEVYESVSSPTEKPFLYVAMVSITLIIVTGGILGFICRTLHRSTRRPEVVTSQAKMEPETLSRTAPTYRQRMSFIHLL